MKKTGLVWYGIICLFTNGVGMMCRDFLYKVGVFLVLVLFVGGCAGQGKSLDEMDAGEIYYRGVKAYHNLNYELAESSFKRLMEEFPLSPYALDAELMLADTYYRVERYEDASSYYTNFVTLHPSHPKAPYALFQKGMSHFKDVLSVDRDQTATRKALFAFEDLVRYYPESPYAEKAKELIRFLRRRLAEREFYVGRFYFKGKNYKGALYRFREILEHYPDVGLTDKTLYYIGESYTRLGEKNLAEEVFSTLIKEFPDSPFAESAKGRLEGS